MKRLLLALALSAGALVAQTGTNVNGVPSVVPVPSSLTAVVTLLTTQYVGVKYVTLHNVTSSDVTVKILDQSTNCNSAACPVVSSSSSTSLTVKANSTYSIPLYGQPAVGGIKWQASSANAVMGWISWSTN
jgi:hypothetical protein